jgi:hypothetical protein
MEYSELGLEDGSPDWGNYSIHAEGTFEDVVAWDCLDDSNCTRKICGLEE